jgi:hypothetical protein
MVACANLRFEGLSPPKPVEREYQSSNRQKVYTKLTKGISLVYIETQPGTVDFSSGDDKNCGLRALFKPCEVGKFGCFRRVRLPDFVLLRDLPISCNLSGSL